MPRTEHPLTTRGVELIRARLESGQHPDMTRTAELLGVDKATLHRACKRAGLTLPRGRRPNPKGEPT